MKIKTWLLSSYLIVMILPLVMAYLLFAWINSYNSDQKVNEFFTTSVEIQRIQTVLANPNLYKPKVEQPEVEQLVNEKLSVVLYNPDGFVLYASIPLQYTQIAVIRKKLYGDLYSLHQGFRSYTYKEPVFDGNQLVGFYELELARDEWVSAVSNRTWLVFGLFFALFLLIYITVIVFVNRKINRRLSSLQYEMIAFASGEKGKETKTNHDEIGELQRHFYDMQKKINEANEIIERDQQVKEYMIATISHDLKTPLTSIRAYAEALDLNDQLSSKEQAEYRQVIVEKSNFMKQMLDDLLTHTLLQSPSYEMDFVDVDGAEFFEMLVSDYEPLCEQKAIHLDVYSEAIGFFEVNPKQMMRVADNLMSNAIQHTADKGHIWLAAITEEKVHWLFDFAKRRYTFDFTKYMYLIVQNNGKGIAEEKISKVFNPLYQTDEARTKKEARGTGLGLSITKQIIEKHGGDVQLLSVEEVGTCVICRIPKIKERGEEDEKS